MECTWSSPNSLRTPMCTGKPGVGGWRTCRLRSAEQGSREFPQDFLPIWGKQKSQGHFDWRCSFNTFTQRKSQDYYLHPSWECCEPEEVPSLLPGAQWAREREQGGKHLLQAGWGGGHKFFTGSTLNEHFKRCSGKSKAGTCGRKSKLGSLFKCPDFWCQQGLHPVKSLSTNSELLLSHHIM